MTDGKFTMARALCVLILTCLLAACVGGGGPEYRRPIARAPAPRPLPEQQSNLGFRQCAARLDALSVRYTSVPERHDASGCALIDTVKLMDFGVASTNLGPMTCPLAANFAAWARYAVLPAGRLYFSADIVRIETYGTYACRNINGNPNMAGKKSEHAHGNAIDVSAFVLSDGRRVSVENDWKTTGTAAQFLRRIHDSACKRFNTVLSPDYNAAHYNHFHLDMGGKAGFCR